MFVLFFFSFLFFSLYYFIFLNCHMVHVWKHCSFASLSSTREGKITIEPIPLKHVKETNKKKRANCSMIDITFKQLAQESFIRFSFLFFKISYSDLSISKPKLISISRYMTSEFNKSTLEISIYSFYRLYLHLNLKILTK